MPDEPDDWSDPVVPLPAEDRLWRHPSEVGVTGAPLAPPPTSPRPRRSRRRLVALALLSGVTGAATTVVALAAMGNLSPRTIQRIERAPAAPTTVAAVTTVSARTLATAIAPAVVEVTASAGDSRRRGSGVVMRADGLLLTSAALVDGADRVVVMWPSGRSLPATDLGHDPITGLAALSVEGSGLAFAPLDARAAEPGATAITVAAGSGGTGPALSEGVVSAIGTHAEPDQGRMLGLIATDRPIPEWADGGALIDDQGHLLGVCLSVPEKATTGFAVPVEVASRVADDLSELGQVDRGWLGVSGTAADPDGAVPAGLAVEAVAAGSPAQDAGLRPGDVLTEVDGARVRSFADVQAALTLSRPGEEITVVRARADRITPVRVDLAASPG